MCKARTPDYEEAPEYARPNEPEQAALYDEAMSRSAMRGGGTRRSTILTGLSGTSSPPVLGANRPATPSTVLG